MVSPSEAFAQQPAGQSQIRVCPGCGSIAPATAQCGLCGEALGVRGHTVATPLPGRPWVRVDLTIPCARCGMEVSPRPDAIEQGAVCPHCTERFAIDSSHWDEALHMAHAVVDLAQPDLLGANAPLGAWNPFADVGAAQPYAQLPSERVPMQSRFVVRAGPGALLCARCRTPVIVRFLPQGRQTTECPHCNDRDAFSLPSSVALRLPALRALMAFTAPPLPGRRPEAWWALFEGPSTLRALVENQKNESDRQVAERAAWEAWQLQERERMEREAQLEAASAERQRQERERRERESRLQGDRERLDHELREATSQLTKTRQALEEAQRQRDASRRELEQSTAQMQQSHRAEMERFQYEANAAMEQTRFTMSQREASWQAIDQRRQQEMADLTRRHKRRWTVAIVLWVIFFGAVAADIAVALGSR